MRSTDDAQPFTLDVIERRHVLGAFVQVQLSHAAVDRLDRAAEQPSDHFRGFMRIDFS